MKLNGKTKKAAVILFFFAILLFLCVFFIKEYPTVLYNSDDWRFLTETRGLYPIWGSLNPCRVLPQVLMPACCWVAAYLVRPLVGGDYVQAITVNSGFVLALCVTFYIYCFYRLLRLRGKLEHFPAACVSLIYLIFHFLVFVRWTDNDYMFCSSSLTLEFFYVIPNVLNGALLFFIAERGNITEWMKEKGNLPGKALFLLWLYLCLLSNLYGSIIVPVWLGSCLLFEMLRKLRSQTFQWKSFLGGNAVQFGILLFWLLVQIFEMNGQRASYLSENHSTGEAIVEKTKELFGHFYHDMNHMFLFLSLAVVLGAAILFLHRRKEEKTKDLLRNFVPLVLACLLSFVYIVLVCAKANSAITYTAEHFSVVYFAFLVIMLCLVAFLERFPNVVLVLPIICLLLIVETNTNGKTFRSMDYATPSQAKAVDDYIIEKVLEADAAGEEILYLSVPEFDYGTWDNFPLADYVGGQISNALVEHGLIDGPIYIEIVPDSSLNGEFHVS